jgi:hypothetical protein
MVKRALASGSVLLSLLLFGPAAGAGAAASPNMSSMVTCTTAGVSSVSRATAVSRGKTWVTYKVPYSQTSCHTDTHGTYRMDCSGFVSMAWGLKGSYTTSTLPSVATRIPRVDLQPGDIMDYPGVHTVMFVGWYDSAHSRANFYQEGSSSTGSYASYGVPLSNYSSYYAYRYNHITS